MFSFHILSNSRYCHLLCLCVSLFDKRQKIAKKILLEYETFLLVFVCFIVLDFIDLLQASHHHLIKHLTEKSTQYSEFVFG